MAGPAPTSPGLSPCRAAALTTSGACFHGDLALLWSRSSAKLFQLLLDTSRRVGPFQKSGQRPEPASGAKATGLPGALARKTRGCRGTPCAGVPNVVLTVSQKGPELVPIPAPAADGAKRSHTWAPAECSLGRQRWVRPAPPPSSTEPLVTAHSRVPSPCPLQGALSPGDPAAGCARLPSPSLLALVSSARVSFTGTPGDGEARALLTPAQGRAGALCVQRCVSLIPYGPGGAAGHQGWSLGARPAPAPGPGLLS